MIKNNKGHVVATASMASFVTVSATTDYAATKAGVLALYEGEPTLASASLLRGRQLTSLFPKGLAQELKHRYSAADVHTTIVHPTWVRTPMLGPNAAIIEKSYGGLIEAEYVADSVVDQILLCRGAQLVLPSTLKLLSCIRAFPYWMQEILRDEPGQIQW